MIWAVCEQTRVATCWGRQREPVAVRFLCNPKCTSTRLSDRLQHVCVVKTARQREWGGGGWIDASSTANDAIGVGNCTHILHCAVCTPCYQAFKGCSCPVVLHVRPIMAPPCGVSMHRSRGAFIHPCGSKLSATPQVGAVDTDGLIRKLRAILPRARA